MAADGRASFSQRFGFRNEIPPIAIWEDAPQEFRHSVLQVANEDCSLARTFRDSDIGRCS